MPDVKFSNLYPYTDFHELNLDWVIKEVKFWSERVGKSIQKIELTGTVGLVDTYTITYSDGTTSTFDVKNGNGITSVAKTGTAGLVDTYTITFQDGSTTMFEVRNGTASIDPTLTLPDYAADAKATGDAISTKVTKPLTETVLTVTAENGYFRNGTITIGGGWKHIQISVNAGEMYKVDCGGNAYVHSYYFCDSQSVVISDSGDTGSTTRIGELIVIPAGCSILYLNIPSSMSSYTEKKLEYANVDMSEIVKGAEIANSIKNCELLYGSFSGAYHATERIRIYIPTAHGYVNFPLYHCEDVSVYCDCWNLIAVQSVTDDFTVRFSLTEGGETESAVKLTGRDDFSGGITHGDEILTDVVFMIDGKAIDITEYTSRTMFTELIVLETTNILDPSDHATVIATHTRKYIFNENGMKLLQTYKWVGAYPVSNAYMPMWLPIKMDNSLSITNKYVTDAGFTPTSTGTNYNIDLPDAKSIMFYSVESASNQQIETDFPSLNVSGSGILNISDNGGLNYNKLYCNIVSGTEYTTSLNELWKSTMIVKIDVSDNS